MASMVHICSDLVGPKSENVKKKKHWFFKCFFEGPRVPGAFQEYEEPIPELSLVVLVPRLGGLGCQVLFRYRLYREALHMQPAALKA